MMRRLPRPNLDPVDLVAAVGAALVSAGTALVFIPAGLIVLGVLLLVYAIAVTRASAQEVQP